MDQINLQELMKKMATKNSNKNLDMTWMKSESSKNEFCYKHLPKKYTFLTGKDLEEANERFKVSHISIKGVSVCPRCNLSLENKKLEKEALEALKENEKKATFNILEKESLIQDYTLKEATFDNYVETGEEEAANKQKAIALSNSIKDGNKINIWLQSKRTGVGKSHLAMAILREVNSIGLSSVFLDIDETLRKIRGSFSDRESKYTEEYIINLATKVDVLVIDDLGAETGDIDTSKKASDYTSKILRAILNGRQSKSTIITTNLDTNALSSIYDPKVISRLMTNVKTIKFEVAADKRPIRDKLKNYAK